VKRGGVFLDTKRCPRISPLDDGAGRNAVGAVFRGM
jgi:hypothetical protein